MKHKIPEHQGHQRPTLLQIVLINRKTVFVTKIYYINLYCDLLLYFRKIERRDINTTNS